MAAQEEWASPGGGTESTTAASSEPGPRYSHGQEQDLPPESAGQADWSILLYPFALTNRILRLSFLTVKRLHQSKPSECSNDSDSLAHEMFFSFSSWNPGCHEWRGCDFQLQRPNLLHFWCRTTWCGLKGDKRMMSSWKYCSKQSAATHDSWSGSSYRGINNSSYGHRIMRKPTNFHLH